jgi:hypothetical protein
MAKTFDCLAMKDNIQRQLLQQTEGTTFEQRRGAIQRALEVSRSPIGDLWRALERRQAMRAGCVAETGEVYITGTDRKANNFPTTGKNTNE